MSDSIDIIPVFHDAAFEVAGVDYSQLSLETRFADLALDSVAMIEIVGLMEERFRVRFDDGELSHMATIRDLSTLLERQRARAAFAG